MDVQKTVLAVLLAALPMPGLLSSDFYLARVGPAPLRFAPVPNSQAFVWPISLNRPSASTNCVNQPAATASTNVAHAFPLTTVQTNPPAGSQSEIIVSSPASFPQTGLGAEANSLSASNLLLLTPQMLADYLRVNLEALNRGQTNGLAGPEIPFTPPTPKPPSSEAIYRTQ